MTAIVLTPWRSILPLRLQPEPERDPTCPDCKGRGRDRHDFDCIRCAGEGVVDE